jgi:hypothetical protein
MYLLQKTANRQAGVGLKLTKFHAIVHMATDMLHFGMPMCFDMGSDEAGHKLMKKAAKGSSFMCFSVVILLFLHVSSLTSSTA